jgi:DNA-binding IclR family transcriptional regulator
VIEERGWVVRHPVHRTYGLGPVALVTGSAAAEHLPVIREARAELGGLSNRLAAEVSLTVRAQDEMLVVANAGKDSPFGTPLRTGQRVPFAAPLGMVFLAWAGDAELETWLERARPRLSDAEAQDQRRVVGTVRERGYAIALDSPARRRLGAAMVEDASAPSELEGLLDALAHSQYHVESLDDGSLYDVSLIAAPVFDENRCVAGAVTAHGFPPAMSTTDIRRAVVDVRGVATIATKRGGGELPEPSESRGVQSGRRR